MTKLNTSVHINVSISHKLYHSYFIYCLKMSPLLLYGKVPLFPPIAAEMTFA